MWPFSNKCKEQPKQTHAEKSLQEIEEFDSRVNGKFSYMGIDYLIVKHYQAFPRRGLIPRLVCHYRNTNGDLGIESFDMSELESIKKHAEYMVKQ